MRNFSISYIHCNTMHTLYITLLFTFLTLTLSVTDRMIFFETGPMIPFFGIPMSLSSFCLLFPFSLAVMHFTVLLQSSEEDFLTSILPEKTDSKKISRIIRKIIETVNYILFYILPFSSFVIFQIRFSAWQNGIAGAYHFILVWFDFFLILYFSPRLKKLFFRRDADLKFIIIMHFKRGLFSLVGSVFLFFSFSRQEILLIRRKKGSIPGIKLMRILKSVPSSWALVLAAVSVLNFSFLYSVLNSEENLSDYTVNSFIISAGFVFQESGSEYSIFFPRLSLPNENLSSGNRINFSGRNFRFADFRGSVLNLNSFHLAHTEHADFADSRWVSKVGE